MGFIIRKVLPEDAYEYTACHIACWQSAYKGIIPDEYLENMPSEQEQRTEKFKQALCDPDNYGFYCAEFDGRIIGRLIIRNGRDEDKQDAGEIAAIYLIEEFWDKGYGREMMNFVISRFRSMGYSEVFLWVLQDNTRARRFYEKHGFTFDGKKAEIEIGKPLIELRYTRNI